MRPTGHGGANSADNHHAMLSAEGPFVAVTDVGRSQPFDQVVSRRRSVRRLYTPRFDDLGLIVARAGLTRHGSTTDLGNSIVSRPAPSGGARHPLRLVVITAQPLNTTHSHRGWVLDPDSAILRPAALSDAAIDRAFNGFADALHLGTIPPAAVVAVGFPSTTLTRYPGGMSLLWRETGALLILVHLAATDLHLGSCFVGTCGVLYPIGQTPDHPVDLGAVAIGTSDPDAG
jgi:hypothetical protein